MMKILFIISYLTGGGAEHVARKNIQCVANKDGFEIAVVTSDKTWKNDKQIKKYLVHDFRVIDNKVSKVFKTLGIKKNYKTMIKALNEFKPNIIHIHDYVVFTPTLIQALNEYKNSNYCKVVMTHHTYNYICTNDSLFNYSTNKLCQKCIGKFDTTIIKDKCTGSLVTSCAKYLQKRKFYKHFKDLIDFHIAPSEFMKSMLVKSGVSNDTVQIIYDPCLDNIIEDQNTIKKEEVIVFFGRVNKEKNIVKFTEVFRESESNMNLLIIGVGNCEDEILSLVSKNKKGNITYINEFLNTKELYAKIKNAKYMVLPSIWYENSPVSIVESINYGLIPLVSNIGGMKELIDYFNIGHSFNPNDKLSIKDCLINLSLNYDNDKASLNLARKKLDTFLVQNYKKNIIELYMKATNK